MSLTSYFNKIWHMDKKSRIRSNEDWIKLGIPSSSDDKIRSEWVDFWLQPWALHEDSLSRKAIVFYGNGIKTLSLIEKFGRKRNSMTYPPS